MEASTNSTFSLQLYELVRSRTDEATAKKVVEAVEGIIETKTKDLVTEQTLKAGLAEMKTDMIKWFFAFFAALALMVLGLYFKK